MVLYMILTVEHTHHRYAIPIDPCTKWNTAQDLESQADITNSDYGKSVKNSSATSNERMHAPLNVTRPHATRQAPRPRSRDCESRSRKVSKKQQRDDKGAHACSPQCHETPRDAPSAPGRGVAIANRDPGKSVKTAARRQRSACMLPSMPRDPGRRPKRPGRGVAIVNRDLGKSLKNNRRTREELRNPSIMLPSDKLVRQGASRGPASVN